MPSTADTSFDRPRAIKVGVASVCLLAAAVMTAYNFGAFDASPPTLAPAPANQEESGGADRNRQAQAPNQRGAGTSSGGVPSGPGWRTSSGELESRTPGR